MGERDRPETPVDVERDEQEAHLLFGGDPESAGAIASDRDPIKAVEAVGAQDDDVAAAGEVAADAHAGRQLR